VTKENEEIKNNKRQSGDIAQNMKKKNRRGHFAQSKVKKRE
jgi:hypothetical protein